LAIKEGVVDKLKKLFSYRSENTYVAIEEEFGVKIKDLDIFLRKKFEYYAKNGLIPITL